MNPDLQRRFDCLEATRLRALAMLEPHTAATLNEAPAPGRWSVLQVLHHVIAAETATLGYIRKKTLAGTSLPPAGLTSRLRALTLEVVLASPLRLRAPAVTASVPAVLDPAGLRAQWDEARASWRGLLDGFPAALERRLVFRHPLVGLLGLADTLGFLQAHLDHHLRHVERALSRR